MNLVKKVRMPIEQAPVDAIRAIAATLISCPCVRALFECLDNSLSPAPAIGAPPVDHWVAHGYAVLSGRMLGRVAGSRDSTRQASTW